jgi:hypothetical protein
LQGTSAQDLHDGKGREGIEPIKIINSLQNWSLVLVWKMPSNWLARQGNTFSHARIRPQKVSGWKRFGIGQGCSRQVPRNGDWPCWCKNPPRKTIKNK